MSQKSNLITLRKRSATLNITNEHSKLIIHLINFITIFIKLLKFHGIFVVKTYLLTQNNICQIKLCIYISAKQIIDYKRFALKDIEVLTTGAVYSSQNFLTKIFYKFFKFYKKSLYLFSFNCINSNIDINIVQLFYPLVLQQRKNLFIRRFNLLIDFLNLTALLCQNLISAELYLQILGQIFKYLTKRQHSIFIGFMQEIFKKLAINSSIKGMKLLINGKLKGKSRASSVIVNHGGVANQTIITDIDFAITHIYTRLGAFGMRIWIQRK